MRCAALLLILMLSMIVSACIGDAHLSGHQMISAILHGPNGHAPNDVIIWSLRLPRILLGSLIGASLGAAGLAFQSLLRNDLADPYIIGVSAGASVGSEAMLLGGMETYLHSAGVPAVAFITATGAMLIVYSLAKRGGRVLVTSLLLGGVVVSSFLGGISMLLLELGHPDDAQRIQYRLNGSLQDATFLQCSFVAICLAVGILLLSKYSRSMNVLSLGEESAQQLGIDVESLKRSLILIGSLLTAATVAFGGIIGFVGLMVPHISRRISRTPDHRKVLPLCVFVGAVLMVWADTLARSLFPDGRELPVGILTAFIGAPFFIYLLRRQSRIQN